MTNNLLSFSFVVLGYRDYIAARFLLNNGFPIQGLTLASTAIEKYLKALLAFQGEKRKVHLDKLSELKTLLSSCYYDVTQHFDTRFMNLLGKAYKARYYDNQNTQISIGFFVNQFVGELDYIIDYFENKVILRVLDENGNVMKTPYKQDVDNKKTELYNNNYLLNGLTKKEHMEKPDDGFAIYFDSQKTYGEIIVQGKGIANKYDGTIWEINLHQVDNMEKPK